MKLYILTLYDVDGSEIHCVYQLREHAIREADRVRQVLNVDAGLFWPVTSWLRDHDVWTVDPSDWWLRLNRVSSGYREVSWSEYETAD